MVVGKKKIRVVHRVYGGWKLKKIRVVHRVTSNGGKIGGTDTMVPESTNQVGMVRRYPI